MANNDDLLMTVAQILRRQLWDDNDPMSLDHAVAQNINKSALDAALDEHATLTAFNESNLDFARLREVSSVRSKRWQGGSEPWSLSDWGVAAGGEMGEMLNIIKKLNRVRDGMIGNNVSEVNLRVELANEIADTIIYLDLLAASIDISLSAAIITKFNATSVKNKLPERL